MSLIAWLPFTKDSRQQGLGSNVKVSGAISLDNNGKLGKCLNSSNEVIINTNQSFGKIWSFCFWGYVTGNSVTGNWTQIARINDGSSNVRVEVCPASYGSGMYCYSIHNNAGYAITNGSISSPAGGYYDKWAHFCLTSDGTTITKYMNGVSVGTSAYNGNGTITGTFVLSNNHITKKNDVRIYDHCLSQMEVKELAKGLVLHYPLNDKYIESTTNLVMREDGLSDTCYNGATSKYGYGTNTDMYKTVDTFQNRKSTKVYMGTAGLNAYPYVYFDAFNAAGTIIQTLSFDYYPTLQNTLIPYSYNGAYNFSYTTDTTSGSATNVSQIIIPVEVGKWNHITITAQKTDTTNTSRGIGYIRIGSASHTSATSNYWLFANVQVEAKDHATGYVGIGGTRTSIIGYDCSGYCNNGVQVGTLSCSPDTPRYNASTHFNGSSAIKNNTFSFSSNQWTASFWYKFTTAPSAYQGFLCLSRNAGGDADKKIAAMPNSNYVWIKFESINYTLSSLKVNEWCHIVLTCDGNVGKVYENGTLKYTTGSVGSILTNCDDFVVGARANSADAATTAVYLNGNMSDVRIYATALSAEDVLELYHTAARIDNIGNTYVYQYIES